MSFATRAYLAILLSVASLSALSAPVRYSYSGNSFEFIDPGMPAVTAISASILLAAPLPVDEMTRIAFDESSSYLEFSISDGVTTVTQDDIGDVVGSYVGLAVFITDATGAIVEWAFDVDRRIGAGGLIGNATLETVLAPSSLRPSPRDLSIYCLSLCFSDPVPINAGSAQALANPEGWTATVVPLPGTVWLFGSALGLLRWLKRRSA